MARIAHALQQAFLAQKVLTRLRAVGTPPLPTLRPQLRAVAHRAGELALAQRPHLRSRAGKVRTSPLATTKVKVRTAKKIIVNASLLPTNLPVVGGAAVALVAPAVADLVEIQVAAPTEEAEMCLGIRIMISIGRW